MSEVASVFLAPAPTVPFLPGIALSGGSGMDIQDLEGQPPVAEVPSPAGDSPDTPSPPPPPVPTATARPTPPEDPDFLGQEGKEAPIGTPGVDGLSNDPIANLLSQFNASRAFFQGQQAGSLEFVVGSTENDLMLLGPLANVVGGGAGDDNIFAGPGDDRVKASAGNDVIHGNQGADVLDGEEGNDLIRAGQDNDTAKGGVGNDIVYGDKGNDSVSGDDGNDRVFGNQGEDTVDGGAGDDTVYGGQDNDSVSGGIGNDVLFGDKGNDRLTGAQGADTFRFEYFAPPGEDVPTAHAEDGNLLGVDTITDFTPNEDKIQLDSRIFSKLQPGMLAEGDVTVTGQFDANAKGTSASKLVYDQTSGLLYYNPTDAAGDEMPLVQLDPNLDIDSNDFEIF
ncbi:calcium-binding protein [Oxynema aestuarii]|jgi:serralysin|uniref:Calcium-binding protein n=1 Tax=Oxynema aestuarii AP17 TaxID=2064643 RepID=A0A6H1U3R4_9CYAN|nr:calcium-binding protein [Oxynema aestuarii]QIZ73471.1 calcium-binding protein [Oxynema aestuarii AP17]RMH71322.1 MAG: calcium-binding protein [Cyanobacteria bacterium J007]